MTDNLVIDPHFRVEHNADRPEELAISFAKRNEGIQTLRITRQTDAELFEIFYDTAGLEFLDAQKDFSPVQAERLRSLGLIGTADEMPQKPTFSCLLDEVVVPVAEQPRPEELIVNPTHRFEPFDLSQFAARLNANLSPNRAAAWVRTPVTGVEMGYWLSHEQAGVISMLKAGAPATRDLDPLLVRKLTAARLLVNEAEIEAEAKILNDRVERTREEFQRFGAGLLTSIFPEHQMLAVRRFYRQFVAEGFMPFGDPQVPNRYYQHNEPLAAQIHKNLCPLMSLVVGAEVKPSYVYAASYSEGAVLVPHRDRAQCEFSISFQVDFEPYEVGASSTWPLYVETVDSESGDRPAIDASTVDETTARAFYLKSGDGLFYKGRELAHFRRALPPGQRSTSLFFHYVPADFAGTLA